MVGELLVNEFYLLADGGRLGGECFGLGFWGERRW